MGIIGLIFMHMGLTIHSIINANWRKMTAWRPKLRRDTLYYLYTKCEVWTSTYSVHDRLELKALWELPLNRNKCDRCRWLVFPSTCCYSAWSAKKNKQLKYTFRCHLRVRPVPVRLPGRCAACYHLLYSCKGARQRNKEIVKEPRRDGAMEVSTKPKGIHLLDLTAHTFMFDTDYRTW